MNIFVVDTDPVIAAQMLCDKHIVKMTLESAQMLSTAHRLIDGQLTYIIKNQRKVKYWEHPTLDDILYKAAHVKHPCTLWTCESIENYNWHYLHFVTLCNEYTKRYGKVHKSDTKLRDILKTTPKNIPIKSLTRFALAMPEEYKCESAVKSYHMYYKMDKARFAKWDKLNNIPKWWK
ncbi:MAG: hypothetical protein HKO92_02235 [Flavobacteriaceae bacterium]|nr:hypothetical protein [Flavobacteriaceae bacterium]